MRAGANTSSGSDFSICGRPPPCKVFCSDLIKALQNTLQGGGRPHMEKSDPELVFAPALIEQAMIHNMAGALTGTLQNDFWQSDTMRRFASSAGSRAGIAF